MARVADLKLTVDQVSLTTNADVVIASGITSSCVERVGKYLYVTGGLEKGKFRNTHPVVGVLDIAQKRWSWLECEGKPIHTARVFLHEDALYAYSAYDWTGSGNGYISMFDLSLEEWSYCNATGGSPGHQRFWLAEYLENLQRFVLFGSNSMQFGVEVYLFTVPECRWIKSVVKGKPPLTTRAHSSCVHQGVIYCCMAYLKEGSVEEMFMLTVGRKDEAIWSSVRIEASPYSFRAQRLISFHGKLLLSGAYANRATTSNFAAYNPEVQEVETVELPQKYLAYFGYGGAVFPLTEGQSFGYLLAERDLYTYIRLTLDD